MVVVGGTGVGVVDDDAPIVVCGASVDDTTVVSGTVVVGVVPITGVVAAVSGAATVDDCGVVEEGKGVVVVVSTQPIIPTVTYKIKE